MELYNDYSVTLLKDKISEKGFKKDNFAIRIGGSKTAVISIT